MKYRIAELSGKIDSCFNPFNNSSMKFNLKQLRTTFGIAVCLFGILFTFYGAISIYKNDFGGKTRYKKHDDITIDDVTITIKSTKKFHKNRIQLLLKTWMKSVLNQVSCCS